MLPERASPYGFQLSNDKSNRTTRLFPWKSTLSILWRLASHQYNTPPEWSKANEFTYASVEFTRTFLAEPSMLACSIFGNLPQLLQYIFLKEQGMLLFNGITQSTNSGKLVILCCKACLTCQLRAVHFFICFSFPLPPPCTLRKYAWNKEVG